MSQIKREDRIDAWFDGSAVCIIAVAANGDPLDLNEHEVEAFITKLQACVAQARQS